MANAFERFSQDVARLTTQANDLRSEKGRLERQIGLLQARYGDIDGLLAEVQEQSIALARNYTGIISQATPDRATPEDTKPVIIIDDEEANINVTPRSGRARQLSPPHPRPQPGPAPQPRPAPPPPPSEPKQHDIIHPKYPTVVLLDSAWTETWCGTCGANVGAARRVFLSGVSGISHHRMYMHKEESFKYQDVVATCGRRVLGDDEAAQMKAGQHPGLKVRVGRVETRQSPFTKQAGEFSSAAAARAADPASTGNARLSGFAITPTVASTTPSALVPPMGTFSSTAPTPAAEDRLTEYEIFHNLEAEAKAAGTPRARKKQRTSTGQPKYADGDFDYTIDDEEEEEQRVRQRAG
ncbi:hypothetical protein LTR36_010070 [Oleoguttula mirabilis]|uniref:Uncharacterized protein n=1 Tax=Oleoguttula mirabilis TaxID=1507867 RepID=A0AAV9JS27_9PEZI|nr:hypothetical protein LTR36_010070 [Oleoguttula mirabilis]